MTNRIKVSQLGTADTLTIDDIFPISDDPSGSPISKRASMQKIVDLFGKGYFSKQVSDTSDLSSEEAAAGYIRTVGTVYGGLFVAVNGGVSDDINIFDSATVGWTWQRVLGKFNSVSTITELEAEPAASGDLKIVSDLVLGGVFKAVNGGTANDGTIFASATVGWTWQRIFSGPVNVKWFDAKGDFTGRAGDGTAIGTDDSTAIQAAIDYAISIHTNFGMYTNNFNLDDISGPAVFFPEGAYLIKSKLIWPSLNYYGAGKSSVKIIVDVGQAADGIELVETQDVDASYDGSSSGTHDIWAGSIRDLTVQGFENGSGEYQARDLISVRSVVRGRIENVNLFLCDGVCLDIPATINFTMANCDFEPRDGRAFRVTGSNATSANFENCYFHRSGRGLPVVDLNKPIGFVFNSCIFESCGNGDSLTAYAVNQYGGSVSYLGCYWENNEKGDLRVTDDADGFGYANVVGGRLLTGSGGSDYHTASGSDTEISVTNPSGDIARYTFTGTGTDPDFDSTKILVGTFVEIESTNLSSANEKAYPETLTSDMFVVSAVGNNYFEVYNSSAIVETATIGAGSISFRKPNFLFEKSLATVSGVGEVASGLVLFRETTDSFARRSSINHSASDFRLLAVDTNWQPQKLSETRNVVYVSGSTLNFGENGAITTREIDLKNTTLGATTTYPKDLIRPAFAAAKVAERFLTDATTPKEYTRILHEMVDTSSGSEDGRLSFYAILAGALTEYLKLSEGILKSLVAMEVQAALSVTGAITTDSNLTVAGEATVNEDLQIGSKLNPPESTYESGRLIIGTNYLWADVDGVLWIKDARETEYSSDFSAGVNGWSATSATLTANTTAPDSTVETLKVDSGDRLQASLPHSNYEVGYKNILQGDIYLESGNPLVGQGIQIQIFSSAGDEFYTLGSPLQVGWNTVKKVFSPTGAFGSGSTITLSRVGANTDYPSERMFLKNWTIETIKPPTSATDGVIVGTQS